VVLVRDRRAEQRHKAVAEKLVYCAFVAMDFGKRQLEEAVQQGVHGLIAQPRCEMG
jgi:hypothetical protein